MATTWCRHWNHRGHHSTTMRGLRASQRLSPVTLSQLHGQLRSGSRLLGFLKMLLLLSSSSSSDSCMLSISHRLLFGPRIALVEHFQFCILILLAVTLVADRVIIVILMGIWRKRKLGVGFSLIVLLN